MAIVVPTSGETQILNRLFNTSTPNNPLEVGLFTSPSVVPGKSTTLVDLVELVIGTDPSYVRKNLGAATNLNGVATFDQLTWVLTGGANAYDVYGYFVLDSVTLELLWCEKFPAKFSIATAIQNGGTIKVTLKMELD